MENKEKEKLINYLFQQKRFKFLQLINDKGKTLSKFKGYYLLDCSPQWFFRTIEKCLVAGLICKEEIKGKRGKPITLTNKGKKVLRILQEIDKNLQKVTFK
jgi:predicted transcriptional regulator